MTDFEMSPVAEEVLIQEALDARVQAAVAETTRARIEERLEDVAPFLRKQLHAQGLYDVDNAQVTDLADAIALNYPLDRRAHGD